uniref:Protein kinase domain-containing protein n=1 Tax=Ananas comosus var. bracteatus TaxID=296719 RepID=A0A6V7QRF0_ANACO
MRYPVPHFVSIVVLLLLIPCISQSLDAPLSEDLLGLIVFKSDLADPFSKLASWDEDDDDPCGWDGVSCNPRTRRVVELSLSGFSLSGKLNRGLLQLQALRKLSLARNNFSGALNPRLAQMESLWSVDLSENALSGPIPDEFFAQCRSIRALNLAKNGFFGQIPGSLGSCSTLVALNLSSNRLSGALPSSLWSLYGLRSLDLSDNSLAGEIPWGVNRLFNLRSISLRGNRLNGKVPEDIGGCLQLKSIDFGTNLLYGNIPESMRNLSLCSYLSLGSNSLAGEVPSWIGDLRSLVSLDLSNNGFSGSVPDSVGNLIFLKRLDFSANRFGGSLPESMGNCRSLIEVDFSWNSLMGNLPKWVFKLGLQRISLSGNQMTGAIEVPSNTQQSLTILDLSSNAFYGGIPINIASIYGLKLLNLSFNSLSGSIPVSIGDLKSLEVLDLKKNKLTGEIPTQIGNCSLLTSLILSQNNLTGPIPAAMANLTNIQIIDLSFNNLTGPIPKKFSDIPHLISFNISHNLFSGDLPSGNFFNTIPPSSVSDNPGICGGVVNKSCPGVLPKPIVLNPNSSSANSNSSNPVFSSDYLKHKKIIFSISVLIAIGAAALIGIGVITITILNIRVRSAAARSAAALALADDYYSRSPSHDSNSGKLVMFSSNDPDFNFGDHAILNKNCELGRGGFGTVYKTILKDGRNMAIKKLTVSSLVKSQEDFEREVKKLGKLRHPNLVTLEGYYWTPSLQLLMYEFIPGGSLYKHLHESSGLIHLSWQERFDTILGIARSLAHLHRMNVIHYNLKSSNILIDGSGEAKVADYGLAKLLPTLDRYVLSSKVQSALGYMAPEFALKTVKITEKCDVYGFGVLVLEIVTGRRPVEYLEDDVVVLCDVVRGALEGGRAEGCMDERLGGKFPVEEAVPVMKLGLICTSQVPSNRPEMTEVVKILEMIRCPQDSLEEELG